MTGIVNSTGARSGIIGTITSVPVISTNTTKPGDGQYTSDSFTKLLIHSDNDDSTTVFTDSSATPHTLSVTSSAMHKTAFYKVDGSSMLFDGSGGRLSISDSTDWQLGTGDWTIDFWAKATETSDTRGFFTYLLDTSNRYHFTNYSNLNFYSLVGGSSEGSLSFVHTRDLLWHHYALVHHDVTLSCYVDGILKGSMTYTVNLNFTGGTFYVGARTGNGSDFSTYSANIYMDEFRFTKGLARWNSNFAIF